MCDEETGSPKVFENLNEVLGFPPADLVVGSGRS